MTRQVSHRSFPLQYIAITPKEYKNDKVTGCDREKCESCYLNHPCASCCLIKPSRKNHSWGRLFVAHEVLVANHPRGASKTTRSALGHFKLVHWAFVRSPSAGHVQVFRPWWSMTIQVVTSQVLDAPSCVVKLC